MDYCNNSLHNFVSVGGAKENVEVILMQNMSEMELPKRKQIRIKEYDYSQNGGYFVTICTHKKQN